MKFTPSTLVAVGFMASLMSPYLALSWRGYRGTWALFGLWLCVAAVERRNAFSLAVREVHRRRWELAALGCWCLVVFVNWGFGRGFTGDVHLLRTITLVMIVLVSMVYASRRDGTYAGAMIGLVMVIGIDAARSLPSLWSNFGFARIIMTANPDPGLVESAAKLGVGSYGLYTANAIGLPVLLALGASSRGVLRLMLLVACLSIASAIALATFTSAIGLMIVGCGLLLGFVIARSRRRFLALAAAAVLICLISAAVLVFMKTPQADFVIRKAGRLVGGVSSLGLVAGDETGRASLFTLSLRTFLDHPLVGIGPSTLRENMALYELVGGHSSWIDQLAEYGILGFGFYIIFLVAIVRHASGLGVAYRRSVISRAALVSAFVYLVAGFVNPVTFESQVAVVFFFIVVSARSVFEDLFGSEIGLSTKRGASIGRSAVANPTV